MKINKLNSFGFGHAILMLAVVIIAAIVGTGYIVATHATPNPQYPNYCSYKVIWSQAGVYSSINGYVIKYKYYGNSVSGVPDPHNSNWVDVQLANTTVVGGGYGGIGYMKAASLQRVGTCSVTIGNSVPIGTISSDPGSTTSGSGTPSSTSTLYINQSLYANQSLYSSDGSHQLILQPDGNLVLYNNSGGGHVYIWQSNTYGRSAGHLIMQPDGNLVLYDASGAYDWQSNTYGSGTNNYLVVQPDGNMVVYKTGGGFVWQSNTYGR
ncbi:MAG TPA: hypothetical protein VLF79_03425 [Candidatus Saccharimonadales bacterium]|nr:hypothetical protein [Candidatus Saccharimonadales bacterium]